MDNQQTTNYFTMFTINKQFIVKLNKIFRV